jgi:hypothetical protein
MTTIALVTIAKLNVLGGSGMMPCRFEKQVRRSINAHPNNSLQVSAG